MYLFIFFAALVYFFFIAALICLAGFTMLQKSDLHGAISTLLNGHELSSPIDKFTNNFSELNNDFRIMLDAVALTSF